jgi:protein TonB
MATLASARLVPVREAFPAPQPGVPANDIAPPAEGPAFERAVYQPSRRAGPVAFLASAGVILAAMAALATLNIVGHHKANSRLTVVSMKELDTTPPPPPPAPAAKLEETVAQPPQAFVPKPKIELPSPGPTQVAIDVPPPVQAPAVVAPPVANVATATPATSAAPAKAGPVDGGDLSSQVISAKPPNYPKESRRQREQGTVKLLVLVGPDGRVSDIEIASSSGSPRLDQAALGAVRRWRWAPQKRAGTAVAVKGYVTIPFVLV